MLELYKEITKAETYYQILFKFYALIRHEVYTKIKQLSSRSRNVDLCDMMS